MLHIHKYIPIFADKIEGFAFIVFACQRCGKYKVIREKTF